MVLAYFNLGLVPLDMHYLSTHSKQRHYFVIHHTFLYNHVQIEEKADIPSCLFSFTSILSNTEQDFLPPCMFMTTSM